MTYKTSLDNLAKGVTIGVTVLFSGIIILGLFSIFKDAERAIPISISIILLLIYFIVFAFRPIDYEISSGKLIIRRPFVDVKIELSQIKTVELLDEEKIGQAFRTFGVGGLFGYFGKMSSSKLGSLTLYATRRNKTVLVQTVNDKKIILTPDEPEKFIANFSL